MEHRESEWNLLREQAEGLLRQPVRLLPTIARTEYRPLLRLWQSPSFSAPKSWCVYQPTGVCRTNYKPAVLETCWEWEFDIKRMRNNPLEGLKFGFKPEPTVSMRFASFELVNNLNLLHQHNQLGLALMPTRSSIALDGTTWGLENFDHFESSRLQWYGNGPDDWQPLVKTFHDLLNTVQETLKDQDYQPYQAELHVEPLKEFITP